MLLYPILSYYSAAPKIQIPQLLKKEKKNKGERYTIRCTAVGNPSPFVQWIKNGATTNNSKLSIERSDLVIESMDESDEGNYSCRAKNRLKTVEKRLLELEMIQPGEFQYSICVYFLFIK